ncbi:molybdenum ABC transporter ATP-binding protein [Rhabdaerophilum calidifontis]|uniref:molybdenum ABC transporter ATP-binding protein n=1 Tax=Rhabdaerophilum calidifontis TaxID=2604328 RepID=UPI001238413E|nr:molybdenum ABC transporter ATP-binding protein [Rhabdaerophilum calidifontis]
MIAFACRLPRDGFTLDAAFEAGSGVTALFGPSGSGKSTVIRLFAGLERPEAGRIRIGDATLLDTAAGLCMAPHRRRIGLVFQDALLFPHLSVRANLTYGRFFAPARERRIAFDPVVEVLGIGHLLGRRPATLSGGERQRMAIGRALLTSPRLLLMDEPLAALDTERKHEILPFIELLRDAFGIPIIYVSHAVEEVARLATRVVRLEQGRVVASGSPAEVLAPASLAEASSRFDAVSVLAAPVSRFMPDYGVTLLDHPAGQIVVPGRIEAPGAVRVIIRATHVALSVGHPGHVSIRTVLRGRVVALETDAGPFALVTVRLEGGDRLRAYATRLATDALGLAVGDEVQALVKAVAIDAHDLAGARPAAD